MPDYEDQRTEKKKKKKKNRDLYLSGSSDVVCTCGTYCGKGIYSPECSCGNDTLTDQPERVIAAEIIREKLLRLLNQEIPHGIAVSVEKMRERENSGLMDVEATIYCERESHKGIVIGKKGAMLKKVSTYAREDMERFFNIRIHLQCWVKVKEDWRNREGLIHNFGLD